MSPNLPSLQVPTPSVVSPDTTLGISPADFELSVSSPPITTIPIPPKPSCGPAKCPCPMAPWLESEYFNLPVVNIIPVDNSQVSHPIQANNMRVGLIISFTSGTNILIGPSQGLQITPKLQGGILLNQYNSRWEITQEQYGNLVMGDFYALADTAQSRICVIEITLNSWPMGS